MIYPSIRIEGSILSPDILERLDDLAGQRPADFGLEGTAKVKDDRACLGRRPGLLAHLSAQVGIGAR
jgi:hypothetical protein